jgi:hypothetical protein
MRVMLHICCQKQRTCSSLHYVNSGPGQMQSCCSTAYSAFNIQLNASQLLLVVCRQLGARYTAHSLQNIAPFSQFVLCQLCALRNPAQLQLCRFYNKYSIDRISVPIGDMSSIRSALCVKFAAIKQRASAHSHYVKSGPYQIARYCNFADIA